MLFVQKRACGYPPLTLEPPYRRRRDAPRGRQTGHSGDAGNEAEKKKIEIIRAGRAKQYRAHPVIFVSTLFEIDSI